MRRWKTAEKDELKKMYPEALKDSILEAFPGRTWGGIKSQAKRMGVVLSRANYKSDASALLNESNQAYYWLGFLCADGNFDEGTISLELSSKDLPHLKQFCDFIGFDQKNIRHRTREAFGGVHQLSVVRISHKEVVYQVTSRLKLVSNKTKIPPDLSSLTESQLLCFFLGFFDGDGTICQRKDGGRNLCLAVDEAWFDTLVMFKNLLARLDVNTSCNVIRYKNLVTNRTLSRWQTGSAKTFLKLYQAGRELQLPLMLRKWGSS